jgi:hypothetical protein
MALYHIVQCRVDTFLDNKTLLELSCANKVTHTHIEHAVQERRYRLFQDTIYYLYYCNEAAARKKLDLQRRYDENYEISIRAIFHLLPELFEFLQDHQVEHIAMASMDANAGCGVSRAMATLFAPYDLSQIYDRFLTLLSQNTTLVSCNAEFFYDIIIFERERLLEAVRHHPTLQVITLSSWSNHPYTLWRAKDGSFYWAPYPRSDPN